MPPPSASVKGAIGEHALTALTLLLSGGDLRASRPAPDDERYDRVLVRPGSTRAAFLQVKTRSTLDRGRYLGLRFPAVTGKDALDGLHILAAQRIPRSPWVGPRFVLIPAREMPRPTPSGQWALRVPLDPASKSRYARFVHDLPELATHLSGALGGHAYPWPPPGGIGRWVRHLSTREAGLVFEGEALAAIATHTRLPLHAWAPVVDDFGQDFSFTDRAHVAALRLQPKGAFGVQPDGQMRIQVRRTTFRPDPWCFLLFMHYDAARLRGPAHVHLVRADEFEELAVHGKGFLLYNGRPEPASKDKWRPWLYRMEEVAGVLETALAARRRGWEPPGRRDAVEAMRKRLRRARA